MQTTTSYRAWIDDIDEPIGYSWGPDGFGHPITGFWRDRSGEQVNIRTMEDFYLLNCIKFLKNDKFRFEHNDVLNWPIYKSLVNEAMRRGIDDRTDWDA